MAKFEFEEEFEKLKKDYPNMFLAGLKYHIESNKIVIKSKKELEKVIEDFKKIEI